MKNMIEVTESNFEKEVLQAQIPVVVDFYAPWCGPCKMIAPLLEQFAAEFEGRIAFAKLNVDNSPELAGTYDVSGVPTMVCFQDGQVADRLVGFGGPRALKSWLERAAASKRITTTLSST